MKQVKNMFAAAVAVGLVAFVSGCCACKPSASACCAKTCTPGAACACCCGQNPCTCNANGACAK
ncbi:MAG TPA: hypothetical protein DD637_04830 [Verrucomicrobia bacterium]|nr:hypothetical protein [Verrucomicrobiota bacterium]HCG20705.1 hypothetical protein [Verrucomicrobiota bacterium]